MTHSTYQVIVRNNPVSLELSVNASIKEGYQPQGGICVCIDASGDGVLYSQAMLLKPQIVFNPTVRVQTVERA